MVGKKNARPNTSETCSGIAQIAAGQPKGGKKAQSVIFRKVSVRLKFGALRAWYTGEVWPSGCSIRTLHRRPFQLWVMSGRHALKIDPGPEALRQRPLAQVFSFSIDSAAVTATGTTC